MGTLALRVPYCLTSEEKKALWHLGLGVLQARGQLWRPGGERHCVWGGNASNQTGGLSPSNSFIVIDWKVTSWPRSFKAPILFAQLSDIILEEFSCWSVIEFRWVHPSFHATYKQNKGNSDLFVPQELFFFIFPSFIVAGVQEQSRRFLSNPVWQ